MQEVNEGDVSDIICPITNNPWNQMEVPVYIPAKDKGAVGYWVEYYAISCWLESHNTCPLSRRYLSINEARGSRDLIFLLDQSHSMSKPAVSAHMKKTLSKEKIEAAQSMRSLDLSAYMLLFILKSLPKCYCTFTVIVFSSSAHVICKRQLLTKTSISDCEKQLRTLSPNAATNWQDPLMMALKEAVVSQQSAKIDTTILMLTDGEPTQQQTTTLECIKDTAQHISNVQFSAFIYGDEANTGLDLINQISRVINSPGNGGLFFVPTPLEMFDTHSSVPIQWLYNYLQKFDAKSSISSDNASAYIDLLSCIIDICKPTQLYGWFGVPPSNIEKAKLIVSQFDSFPIDPCVHQALLFMDTWGLPALYTLRAQHELRYTANVFDESTQQYQNQDNDLRTALKQQLQDFTVSGQICGSIGQVSTSTTSTNYHTYSNSYVSNNHNTYTQPPVALSQIYTAAGGCFTANTQFFNENGPILVSELVTNGGGKLRTKPNTLATVQHIICREIARSKKILLLSNSTIGITEWHPVIPFHLGTSATWTFSQSCSHTELPDSDKHGADEETQLVYSIIFEPDIDGTRPSTIWTPSHYVAAAGHGLVCPKTHPVIGHVYWGEGILDDVKKLQGNVCVLFN